ncbi:hypothetical protein [Pseudogemmobacter bohemicus]|uniref:hypothetical protein n=1 Tax=Pseudogemmobacter bohemicus TaxID=2250708 RepID=UPI00130025B4|nr:hypothetical protein [Pseudogemmobacter bohemicus]
MARPFPASLLMAAFMALPLHAETGGQLLSLTEAGTLPGSDHYDEQRNAAWAACILSGHEQAAQTRRFVAAGWTRGEEEDGAFSLHAPGGHGETLRVMLYEGDTSCSIVDLRTNTLTARATIGEMPDTPGFTAEEIAVKGECPFDRVTLAPFVGNPGPVFTIEIRSGGDYADCNPEEASAVILGEAV